MYAVIYGKDAVETYFLGKHRGVGLYISSIRIRSNYKYRTSLQTTMAYVHPTFHGGRNQPEQVTDDHLTCGLCHFPGFLHPKLLQCGHTFCRSCLEQYLRDTPRPTAFPCPTCKMAVPLPSRGAGALPNNIFIGTQVDRLLRRHNNAWTGGRGNSFYNIVSYE